MDLLADPWLPALAASMVFAYAVQTMTGFGSQVIVLSISAVVYPLAVTMPVVLALNLLMCGFVALRMRRAVDVKLLATEVFPWMGLGVLAGIATLRGFGFLPPKWPFGLVVVAFALKELRALSRRLAAVESAPATRRAWLASGGFVHAFYASGGPLVVTALAGTTLDRDRFRATLMTMWFVFNGVVLANVVTAGGWDHGTSVRTLALAPTVPLGIWIGEALKTRVNDRGFRVVVQATLLVAGLALLA